MISESQPIRVMWLLNHSSARKFEIPMLKSIGINQIFLPKSFPSDPSFRSVSVDYSEDKNLDIPDADLQLLNAQDWYQGGTPEAWHIANKYFDLLFFILHTPETLESIAKNFKGAVLWRAYGLDQTLSYSKLIKHCNQSQNINKLGRRFYFGEAYSHIADKENEIIKNKRVFLPLGMANPTISNQWEGKNRQLYFVCPDIAFNPYYRKIYGDFSKNFKNINYVIAGAQPLRVNDPKVLGYVSNEQHTENMTQSRVMFYHSQEPNHIHYHPFEAIRVGMPLVFMADGMLDRMGGKNLPGRCKTIQEARKKIERILADDWKLISEIRESQQILLEPMKPENCEPAWRKGFERIVSELHAWRSEQSTRPLVQRRKRVAVILPVAYRGGSLRGAIELARALYIGSRQCHENADIVFLHLDDPEIYPEDAFADLPKEIVRRSFKWRNLSAAEALRAMHYAGFQSWEPKLDNYTVPDDNIQQLHDCDLWLVISDRTLTPLLPIKPIVIMIYDYIQRYVNIISRESDILFLSAARSADKVLVTTEFTKQDALQYAGLEQYKVKKLPILAPKFPIDSNIKKVEKIKNSYFVWTTNASPHKNHQVAAEALRIYYEELDGKWSCKVTGVNTKELIDSQRSHLKTMQTIFKKSKILQKRVKWLGDLSDVQYKKLLNHAEFLWHAGQIDNGTFSVIEAAFSGIPSLSSDYPAMREIDKQFSLNLAWMDPNSARNMAEQLKTMEQTAMIRRSLLPNEAQLYAQNTENYAHTYWQELRSCL